MFKASLVFLISLLCNGCASSSSQLSNTVHVQKTTKLQRYASNDGCKMLPNGYMVCPKSR